MAHLTLTIEFQAEGERLVMVAALRDAYRKVLADNDDLPDDVKLHCESRCDELSELIKCSQFLMAVESHDCHHSPGSA